MSRKDHEFEIPLALSLPETPVSAGADWLPDCEEDEIFGLQPECFSNKNLYDAALKLCEVCDGWYYFEDKNQWQITLDGLRLTLQAKPGEPMWYYDIRHIEEQCGRYSDANWTVKIRATIRRNLAAD